MTKQRILFTVLAAFSLVLTPALSHAAEGDSDDTPTLEDVRAVNSGGTSAKEAGDSIVLEFSEPTNKPTINASNVDDIFDLDHGHSFLDGDNDLGSASWSSDGKTLTIVLSDDTSLPTIAVGDTVTMSGDDVTDLDDNVVTGSEDIDGSFTVVDNDDDDDDEDVDDDNDDNDNDQDEDEDDHSGKLCDNSLRNGRLYKVGSAQTVYLASNCSLKPFRGAAVFHARGLKFENITTLSALPTNVTVSQEPVLPAEGTLVKGSDKTVWFVDHKGHKKGFVNADIFAHLGFHFDQVLDVSDTDLALIPADDNITSDTSHPDGALIKCGDSAAVFEVIGGTRFPFANAEVFQSRGHSFDHILNVDCGRFHYQQGAALTQ